MIQSAQPNWWNSTRSLPLSITVKLLTLPRPAPGRSASPNSAGNPARERLPPQRRCTLDLDEIWEYIAADNIEGVDHWIGKLFDAFEAIGKTPGLGHRREDLTAYPALFWPVDVGTNADVAGFKACSTKQHTRNQMWGGRPRPP